MVILQRGRLYSSLLHSRLIPFVQHRAVEFDTISLFKSLHEIYPNHAKTLTEYVASRVHERIKVVPPYQIYRDLPRVTNTVPTGKLHEEEINFEGKYWKVAEEWRSQPGALRNELLLVLANQRESGREVAAKLERLLAQIDAEQAVKWSGWRSRLEDVKLRAKYIYSIMLICIYFTIFGEVFIWRR